MAKLDAAALVDSKLDGARVQVHRDGDDVAVFTRTLDDVTARLPEVVALARALPARALVLDGEAIALRADGRPEPFQVTAARFGTRGGARRAPLALAASSTCCTSTAPTCSTSRSRAGRRRSPRPCRAEHRVAARGRRRRRGGAGARSTRRWPPGHEGVVVKALDAPYAAGRRGSGWLKVKPVHTLDLVVLAAEWGHGRRRGFLSNLHLGARDDATGGWAMLGKTFKGLTDELLAWQTEQLLARETRREGIAVFVRPELVVEIAFDGIQTSLALPVRDGPALRARQALPRRQDRRRGRHGRDGPRESRGADSHRLERPGRAGGHERRHARRRPPAASRSASPRTRRSARRAARRGSGSGGPPAARRPSGSRTAPSPAPTVMWAVPGGQWK